MITSGGFGFTWHYLNISSSMQYKIIIVSAVVPKSSMKNEPMEKESIAKHFIK